MLLIFIPYTHRYCELCKYPFAFTPGRHIALVCLPKFALYLTLPLLSTVYAADMPETLPAALFVRQLLRKASGIIRITLRAIVVVFVWLIMLPYITLWVWRFYFWIGDNLALSMHNDNSTITSNLTHAVDNDQYTSENNTSLDSIQVETRYTAR